MLIAAKLNVIGNTPVNVYFIGIFCWILVFNSGLLNSENRLNNKGIDTMKQLFLSCVLVTGLAACSSSSEQEQSTDAAKSDDQATEQNIFQPQAKYGFSYLESVKVVSGFNMTSFQAVDGKSVIVRSKDRNYLLVLSKVNLSIPMTHHIYIGSKGRLVSSSISSGTDKLALNAGFSNASSINAIYEIENAEQEERSSCTVALHDHP